SLLDGYHLLKRTCDQVFVLGFSVGGLLALRLAASERVTGVVAMAVPFEPPTSYAWIVHGLRYVVPFVATYDRETDPIDKRVREFQQQRGELVTGRIAYYKQSTAGVAEMLKLQREVRANLNRIKAPVLLIFSEKDTTASLRDMEQIERLL